MVQDNINLIIQNAINSKKYNDIKKENELIANLKKAILENYTLFETTNKIDLSNNNGFVLEKNTMETIIDRYINAIPLINSKDNSTITENDLLMSNVYSNLGIVHVIFDGNTYTMLELILLGILTHNTIIFTSNGYMHGTNGLLLNIVHTILEKEEYKKEMFQHSFIIRPEDFFDSFKTINKTIVIGDSEMQNKYNKLCANALLISGYNNYDIYIEDLEHVETIKKIISQKLNINLYINSGLKVKADNAIFVEDIDEAITQINFNSSGYSSSIFTKNNENASKFIKNINSKNVLVNASPTLVQQLDIKQEDLLKEKNIILPNIYKFDGFKSNIEIN